MQDLLHTLNSNMFALPVPLIEKILRPVIMYVVLVVFLRMFGKRELAQLNPFDLVVLLCLSNTVQNAIIGNDNSVTGGVVGALSLLGINWGLSNVLFRAPKLNRALEGDAAILIRDGDIDEAALTREKLTHEELLSVVNKNGLNDLGDVELCVLEPNGTFFVKAKAITTDDRAMSDVLHSLERLTIEVRELQRKLDLRG